MSYVSSAGVRVIQTSVAVHPGTCWKCDKPFAVGADIACTWDGWMHLACTELPRPPTG